MDERASTVFGIYNTRKQANQGIKALKKSGIRADDISLRRSYTPPAPVDAAHWGGGIAGAVIGGSVGLAAGLGVWALPLVEAIVIGGPITGTLVGGALGAWGGHAILDGDDGPGEETFVSVHPHSSGDVGRAIRAFEDSGADDVFVEEKPLAQTEKDILQFHM